ncbi:hypothetical protein DPMN_045856 [Dreissena polymorpha]|uniref:Uncharacterized protein n=1 Tax=Dreissena polymorpha TaxID=45954 RepID=A0A9D4I004_DREPO|nr:hypothetical protein DPMN_045856 [Dreissena polymorpha]
MGQSTSSPVDDSLPIDLQVQSCDRKILDLEQRLNDLNIRLENITDESKQRTLRKTYVEKATEYNDLMNHVTFVQNRYRHVSSLANGSLEKELQEKHRRNMEKLQRIKRTETELKQDFRDISPTTTPGHVMSRLQAIVQFQLDSLASNVTKLESKTTEIEKMRNGFNGGWKLALGWQQRINKFREQGIQSELILTAELDADKEKIIQLETIVKKLKAMNATKWSLELNDE